MYQINFNNHRNKLTENDIGQLYFLISSRCHKKTKDRILSMLKYGKSAIPQYGIFNRLIKEDERWTYCAGQDYVSEMALIRNLITKGG